MIPTQSDLFGGTSAPKVRADYSQPAGYAGKPGAGPSGQTCGSCRFCRWRQMAGRKYFKCQRMSAVWTRDRSTDISVRSPACDRFEAGTPRQSGIR